MMETVEEVPRRHTDAIGNRFKWARRADGWCSLIDQTLAELKRRCPSVKITTMKANLGRLRIYSADLMDEEAKIVLRNAEGRFGSICERTGEPGRMVSGDGWVGTRCQDHEDGGSMNTGHDTLMGYIKHHRHNAVDRDHPITFTALPLFVLAAYFVPDIMVFRAFSHAIDDGHGDPVDLDTHDRRQTSRLESKILELAHSYLTISEVKSVEWFDLDSGPRAVSICIVATREKHLLVIHYIEAVPSLSAVAAGRRARLLEIVAEGSSRVLPRVGSDWGDLREVVVRTEVPWSEDQIAAMAAALTGIQQSAGHGSLADLASRRLA